MGGPSAISRRNRCPRLPSVDGTDVLGEFHEKLYAARISRLGLVPLPRSRVRRTELEDVELALDGHAHGLVDGDRAVRVQRIDRELHLRTVAGREFRERSVQQRLGDSAPTPGLDHPQHADEPFALVQDRYEMTHDSAI